MILNVIVVSMPATSQNLVLKAPTAHHVTLRLNSHSISGNPATASMVLEPARSGEDTWQFGVVSCCRIKSGPLLDLAIRH